MTLLTSETVAVIGGGPVGSLAAAYLARRGCEVDVYERRPDMRRAVGMAAGRSINLVLTERGLRGLELIGLRESILELTVAVTGRMTHGRDGSLTFLRYGKDDSECNYSVSRGELNCALLDAAEQAGAQLHFESELEDVDFDRRQLLLRRGGEPLRVSPRCVLGCDGAPSALREALVDRCGFEADVELLDHGYKELTFAAGPDGGFAMEPHALHIWARGDQMLMGLPNRDGSFTGTVYLPKQGEDSFESLSDEQVVRRYFERHYADAVPLIEDLERAFVENPLGTLGTVRCRPWHLDDFALLVGDAAHGIVPFFGQGLNCGFEDCVVLAALLDRSETLEAALSAFTAERKADGDAIAEMALENFVEMRAAVADPRFLLKKAIEQRIEQSMPQRYRSRYAMVMYSAIPYAVAREAGVIQQQILDELARDVERADQVDLARAERLVAERLSPFLAERSVSLAF